jgi:clan AA aspartic protease (TIGR02281 family)
LTCIQLEDERQHIANELTAASVRQNQARALDTAGVLAIGLPLGSIFGGNAGPQIARIKGEQEAVQTAIRHSSCGGLASQGRTEVPLQQDGSGVYVIAATINASTTMPFVLDTGASDISIPRNVAVKLAHNGTLSGVDYKGDGIFTLADGGQHKHPMFRLRSVTVGGITVNDVMCSVDTDAATPLLGQTFLSRLGSWSIDNRRHVLVVQ